MESIENQIETYVKRKPLGSLFIPDDFSGFGSSDGVRKALERLEDKEVIFRIAQGIYTRPKKSKLIGEVMPSAEEVAEAIIKRDKVRTVPTGSYALNALGLSTNAIKLSF